MSTTQHLSESRAVSDSDIVHFVECLSFINKYNTLADPGYRLWASRKKLEAFREKGQATWNSIWKLSMEGAPFYDQFDVDVAHFDLQALAKAYHDGVNDIERRRCAPMMGRFADELSKTSAMIKKEHLLAPTETKRVRAAYSRWRELHEEFKAAYAKWDKHRYNLAFWRAAANIHAQALVAELEAVRYIAIGKKEKGRNGNFAGLINSHLSHSTDNTRAKTPSSESAMQPGHLRFPSQALPDSPVVRFVKCLSFINKLGDLSDHLAGNDYPNSDAVRELREFQPKGNTIWEDIYKLARTGKDFYPEFELEVQSLGLDALEAAQRTAVAALAPRELEAILQRYSASLNKKATERVKYLRLHPWEKRRKGDAWDPMDALCADFNFALERFKENRSDLDAWHQATTLYAQAKVAEMEAKHLVSTDKRDTSNKAGMQSLAKAAAWEGNNKNIISSRKARLYQIGQR